MKKIDEPQQQDWKPSLREAKELSEKLKLYSKKEINGRMQYPFELYLEKQNIISFDDWGYIQVKNPLQYHRMSETDDLRVWLEEKDLEHVFETFPEEKEAFETKKKEWMMACRDMVQGIKV